MVHNSLTCSSNYAKDQNGSSYDNKPKSYKAHPFVFWKALGVLWSRRNYLALYFKYFHDPYFVKILVYQYLYVTFIQDAGIFIAHTTFEMLGGI